MSQLCEEIVLDFSKCNERQELYAVMAERMLWQKDYGRNLDALYDILTGMPHIGRSFAVKLPGEESPCRAYAEWFSGDEPQCRQAVAWETLSLNSDL